MKKQEFSFNAKTHNFWPIYNAISYFYPIGITGDYPSLFFQYPNLKALEQRVVDAVHDEARFNVWETFESEIHQAYALEVVGTTYGQAPSLSFDVILERFEEGNLRRVKKLSAAVSLVGNFFILYGVDETFVIEEDQNELNFAYHAINAITVSPYKEFEHLFVALKTIIETKFNGYRFVPYAIADTILKGLRVRYKDDSDDATIYNALFNNFLDSSNASVRGDKFFGHKDWSIDTNNQNASGVLVSPPPQA